MEDDDGLLRRLSFLPRNLHQPPTPLVHKPAMAVGSIPDAPYDPANATSYGDNFYPAQNDPNKTTIPARPAPPTTANLWEAIKVSH